MAKSSEKGSVTNGVHLTFLLSFHGKKIMICTGPKKTAEKLDPKRLKDDSTSACDPYNYTIESLGINNTVY